MITSKITLCLSLLAGLALEAQSQLPPPPSLSQPALPSIAAKAEIKKVFGTETNENLTTTVEWKEKGPYYMCRLVMHRFGQQSLDLTDSYDGTKFFCLDQSGSASSLRVSKKKPERILSFDFGGSPLQPFQFLARSQKESNDNLPRFSQIVEFFNPVSLKAKAFSEANFAGKPAVSITLPGGSTFEKNESLTYDAYFSKDGYKLLGWRRQKDGKPSAELVVTKWEVLKLPAGFEIQMPVEFETKFFALKDGSEEPKPSYVYQSKVTFEPDPKGFEEEDFSIDPASVGFVYDMDSQVLIPIPN